MEIKVDKNMEYLRNLDVVTLKKLNTFDDGVEGIIIIVRKKDNIITSKTLYNDDIIKIIDGILADELCLPF